MMACSTPPPPPPDAYKALILARNPFGYYRLDEDTGTTAANSGSSGPTGAYVNA